MKNKNILYVIAMEKEAKEIIKYLELEKVESEQLDLYKKDNISLLITGIGKQRTAIALATYLERNKKEKTDIIINLGYAGSTNTKIGTWVNVTKSYNYEWKDEDHIISGYDNEKLIKKLENETILQLSCYSAESFVTETDIKEDVLFDMELHSIYMLCCAHNIYLLSLKKVSDNLNLDDYYKNIEIENLMELVSGLELIDSNLK